MDLKSVITEVKVTLLQAREGSKTAAFVGVTIAGHLALKDIKVIEGSNGLFVSMPQRKATIGGEEKYVDIFHPITKEGREELQKIILDAYQDALSGKSGGSASAGRGASASAPSTRQEGAPSGARSAGARTRSNNDDDVPF
jgi:stage V sporulation protein G